MTDFKLGDKVITTAPPPALDGSYVGLTGVITTICTNASSWDFLVKFGEGSIYVKASGIKLVEDPAVAYRYEVKATNFYRTYDNEGKAIAVARALRDFMQAQDEFLFADVVLTKTPTAIVPEKVNF